MKAAVRITVAAALAVAAAQAGMGQDAGGSLKGHDTDAPVDVAADRIEVQDRADRAIFSGNVEVRQGSLRLSTSRLTVAYANESGIAIQRLEASGGVLLRSPAETARSEFAVYDLDRRIVTMLGGVTLTRGTSHVEGARLVLDLDSGRAVMDGGAPGAPGTAAGGGRVSGRFTVPRRN